jgi:flagellar biogenesis protein FliO
MGGYLASVTGVLLGIVGLGLAALRVLRGGGGGARAMRVRERIVLDGRRAIYLVEVAGRVLVVGGTDGGLSTLAEVDAARLPVDEPAGRGVWAEALRRVVR